MLGDFRRTSSACSVNWCTQSWESKVSWRGWFFLFCLGPVPSFLWADTSSRLGVIRMKCSTQASTSLQRRFWATRVKGRWAFLSFNMPWRYQICIQLSSVFTLIVYSRIDHLHKSFFSLLGSIFLDVFFVCLQWWRMEVFFSFLLADGDILTANNTPNNLAWV